MLKDAVAAVLDDDTSPVPLLHKMHTKQPQN